MGFEGIREMLVNKGRRYGMSTLNRRRRVLFIKSKCKRFGIGGKTVMVYVKVNRVKVKSFIRYNQLNEGDKFTERCFKQINNK